MCNIAILLRCLNIGVHSAVVFKRGDLLQWGYVETPVIFVLVPTAEIPECYFSLM